VKVLKQMQGIISRVETCGIKNNQILALSVNKQDIERCEEVIREYGLLTPPVVGSFGNGKQIVLAGECEMLALKGMGIKSVDAVTIAIDKEEDVSKISLLISMLKKNPNGISEGLMLNELLKGGKYNQYQLGKLFGKSKSWVSKRISLITRLEPAVCELVTQKQLCSHSAQEISRLPSKLQHKFSLKVVQEGLPKSAVEVLVSCFNNSNYPDSLKKQIIECPSHAIEKIANERNIKSKRDKKNKETQIIPIQSLQNNLVLLLRCIKEGEYQLPQAHPQQLEGQVPLLKNCKISISRFYILIESILNRGKDSLGKQERNE
jgi:ParB family chromosome partitioning protein